VLGAIEFRHTLPILIWPRRVTAQLYVVMLGQEFKFGFFSGHSRRSKQPKGGQNDEFNGVFQEGLPSTSSTFNASAIQAVFSVEVVVWLGRHICSPSHCWPHQQRPLISIRQVPVSHQRVSCIVLLLLVGVTIKIVPVRATFGVACGTTRWLAVGLCCSTVHHLCHAFLTHGSQPSCLT